MVSVKSVKFFHLVRSANMNFLLLEKLKGKKMKKILKFMTKRGVILQ